MARRGTTVRYSLRPHGPRPRDDRRGRCTPHRALGCVGVAAVSFKSPSELGTSQPVKPIPIPTSACPYLRLVSVSASAASLWDQGLTANDPTSWRVFAERMAPTLASLQRSLQLAMPHVPHPVAAKVQVALHEVVIGRPALMTSRSSGDYFYFDRTNWAPLDGYNALADASGLVGNACGFTLAPSARL